MIFENYDNLDADDFDLIDELDLDDHDFYRDYPNPADY